MGRSSVDSVIADPNTPNLNAVVLTSAPADTGQAALAVRVISQPGGAGSAVTVADGADVAQGTTSDAAWVAGSGTVISLLKKIASAGGSAVSIADGADIAQGTTTDLSSANTVVGILKAIKAAITGTVAVSGPLTDTQLRASAVPVSGTVATGALTDTQLRAAAVPVSASGSFPVTDNAGSLTVDAPVGTPAFVRLSDGAAAIAALPVTDNAGSLTVDAPVGTPAFVRLSDGVNPITALPVTDNAGSLTVDAPVGTPAFVRLSDGAAALIGQKTSALGLPVTVSSDQVIVDNAGFNDGASTLLMHGFIFDETAGIALTENDAAAGRVDSKRAQVSVIEDGTIRGTRATVKAANIGPLAGDTAVSVVLRNTPVESTGLASASRAAGTYTVDILDTTGYTGAFIVTDLTVLGASSTVTNTLQVRDPVTGAKFATATAAAFTVINSISTTRQAMHPANSGTSGNLQGGLMGKTLRISCVVAVAASTFSIGYILTP